MKGGERRRIRGREKERSERVRRRIGERKEENWREEGGELKEVVKQGG